MKLIAEQISAANTITNFIGGILPNLTNYYGIFLGLFNPIAKCIQKLIGKFIGNIEANTSRAKC